MKTTQLLLTLGLTVALLALIPTLQAGCISKQTDEDTEPPLFTRYGIIHGTTYINHGWRLLPRPFIFITAENANIKRVTISGPFAHYRLILPLNHEYTLTAGGCLSKTITLSSDDPYTQLDFQF